MNLIKLLATNPLRVMLIIALLTLGYQAWHYRSMTEDMQEVIDLQVIEHDLIIQQLALSESSLSLCEAQRNELSDRIPTIERVCKSKIDEAIKSAIANFSTPDIKPARTSEEFNEWMNETIKP